MPVTRDVEEMRAKLARLDALAQECGLLALLERVMRGDWDAFIELRLVLPMIPMELRERLAGRIKTLSDNT